MPLTLAGLVTRPELRLAVATGGDRLDRRILAAHVSELERPGTWLLGGELLMTSALLLPMDEASCRDYVADVAAGGAAALALGLGRSLPYQEAPEPLVRAAAGAGLPLLTVPDEVPFVRITRVVFETQAAEQRAALERAFEAQRQLTAAAAAGRGLTPTLAAWTRATGVPAVVCDPLGRLIAATAARPQALLDARSELIHKVAARGMRGSGSETLGAARAEVQPLGARRLRGVLVLDGTGTVQGAEGPLAPDAEADTGPLAPDAEMGKGLPAPEAQLLTSGLVSLLSLELERRHLADEPERRRRSALLGRLLDADTTAEQARDVLGAAGLAATVVRGLAVDAGGAGEDADEIAADLALALPGGLVRALGTVVEAVAGGDLDVGASLERFAPGCPAGIGGPVAPEAALASLRQASGLLALSRSSGRVMEIGESASSRLLLQLGGGTALAGYADALLGPLDVADPSGDLVRTLATWLDSGGSWDETGRRLGVHRHTVRNRLDKAMRLTGRRLDHGDDRFDLWLATRARRAARQGAADVTPDT